MEYLSFWLIFDLHECKIEKQNVHYEKIFLIDWPRSFCEMTGIPYSFFFFAFRKTKFSVKSMITSPHSNFLVLQNINLTTEKRGFFFVVALLISREPWEKIQYPSFKLAYTPEHNFHQKDTYVSSWLQSIC